MQSKAEEFYQKHLEPLLKRVTSTTNLPMPEFIVKEANILCTELMPEDTANLFKKDMIAKTLIELTCMYSNQYQLLSPKAEADYRNRLNEAIKVNASSQAPTGPGKFTQTVNTVSAYKPQFYYYGINTEVQYKNDKYRVYIDIDKFSKIANDLEKYKSEHKMEHISNKI